MIIWSSEQEPRSKGFTERPLHSPYIFPERTPENHRNATEKPPERTRNVHGTHAKQPRNRTPDPTPITQPPHRYRGTVGVRLRTNTLDHRDFRGLIRPSRLTLLRVWTCCSKQPPKIKVSPLFCLSDTRKTYRYGEACIVYASRSSQYQPFTTLTIP